MAWRFKASKYKNAAPIVPKPEVCVRDICVGSYQTYGNNIAASAAFMAFNWEHAGSSLAVLPIDDCGRKSKTMPLLHCHADTVTDLHFSPFHDGLLATGSQDCLVKIWFIPEKGLETSLTEPECTFSHKQRRVETVGFHPAADCLLHSTSAGNITLWDISVQKEVFSNNEHPEVIQSLSWKQDGSLLTTSCKDKMVRIFDPRINDPITMTAESHQSIKDSRVVWLGDQSKVLSTGFDSSRLRQIIIRDLRNFNTPEKTLELDCSTGILIPLYDSDTNMLFLAGKGDTTISYMEVTDKDPHLIEGLRHNGEQTKGACLVPKRALRVMEGEVNRIMQLTSNSVIPIMYQVPRKTYRDFHSDLYPDTNGYKTDLSVAQWLNGINIAVSKMSLDPAKRENGDQPIVIHKGNLNEFIKNQENNKLLKNTTNNNQQQSCIISTKPFVDNNKTKYKPQQQQQQQQHSQQHQQQQQHQQNQLIDIDNNNDDDNEKPLTKKDLIKRFDNKYKNNNKETIDDDIIKNKLNESGSDVDQVSNKDLIDYCNDNKYNSFDDKIIKNDYEHKNHYGIEQIKNGHSHNNNNNNNNNNEIAINKKTINVVTQSSTTTSSSSSVPPKPLPRTSRNNSVSEQGNNNHQPIEDILDNNKTPLRPIAKPRTTTSYKPRLGPKPFTSSSCSGDISFDKVFSVPQVPGGESIDSEHINNVSIESTDSSSSVEEQKPDNSEKGEEVNAEYENHNNGIEKDCDDMENNHIDLLDNKEDVDDIVFIRPDNKTAPDDNNSNESDKYMDTNEDKTESDLQRLSLNRSSIAERRKIYENRSLSVQEEKPLSPLPATRKESIQNRMETSKSVDDNKIKSSDNFKIFDENNGSNNRLIDVKKVNNNNNSKNVQTEQNTATKRTSTVFGKVSKFRHLKGTPGHKSTHIENIRNISRQIPGECNGFHANHQRVAIPISGPGGKIAVYELNKPGRLPDGVIPSLVNSSNVMDFQWDPFDALKLVVACDDGIVKIWNIPEDGLTEPTNICDTEFAAHSDKIYFIRFHPLAKDILLTASYDMTIKLWDLESKTEKFCLQGHTDQIFDFAWSPCGQFGATVCRDGKIRIFNPRKSENCIREGAGPIGTRGARITWAIEGQYILCTGFDKVSERQITIYKATDLSAPLNTVGIDVSPAILMPFYDEDSSTLFVTGRGDSTIYAFEITDEPSHICPLSHHRYLTLHQGLSFLTKNQCDVTAVEFAKALRLTNNTIQPLSFTVPRVKPELFQDDLFPPTRVTWSPTMTSDEWFSLKDKKVKKINLQPDGMECLSAVQAIEKQQNKKTEQAQISQLSQPPPFTRLGYSSEADKVKQEKIQQSVSARMEFNSKLEQDNMEGVGEEEWDE